MHGIEALISIRYQVHSLWSPFVQCLRLYLNQMIFNNNQQFEADAENSPRLESHAVADISNLGKHQTTDSTLLITITIDPSNVQFQKRNPHVLSNDSSITSPIVDFKNLFQPSFRSLSPTVLFKWRTSCSPRRS
jgi:hypothetical protein